MINATAPPPVSLQVPQPKPTADDAASIYETGVEDNDEDDGGAGSDSTALNHLNLGGVVSGPTIQKAPSVASTVSTALDPGAGGGGGEKPQRRKSVRMAVPPSPMTEFPPASPAKSTRSANNTGSYMPSQPTGSVVSSAAGGSNGARGGGAWNSKIGSSGGWGAPDSSDDEDEDETDYAVARRAMERAQRHWDKAGKDKKSKGKERS